MFQTSPIDFAPVAFTLREGGDFRGLLNTGSEVTIAVCLMVLCWISRWLSDWQQRRLLRQCNES
jgi:hypothetical protein